MLLKDYKNLYLYTDTLEINYTYWPFIKPSNKFQLKSIQEFKVVKYSLQTRLSTAVYISCVAGYDIKTKRISMRVEGKRSEFQLLLNDLREKGVLVETEGDYWK